MEEESPNKIQLSSNSKKEDENIPILCGLQLFWHGI